jgi:hypothetical protein
MGPNNVSVPVTVRLQHEPLTMFDGWIKARNVILSRPEAIRKLIERALYPPHCDSLTKRNWPLWTGT